VAVQNSSCSAACSKSRSNDCSSPFFIVFLHQADSSSQLRGPISFERFPSDQLLSFRSLLRLLDETMSHDDHLPLIVEPEYTDSSLFKLPDLRLDLMRDRRVPRQPVAGDHPKPGQQPHPLFSKRTPGARLSLWIVHAFSQ